MPNEKIPGAGSHHIALSSADFDRSLRFYTEGLGMRRGLLGRGRGAGGPAGHRRRLTHRAVCQRNRAALAKRALRAFRHPHRRPGQGVRGRAGRRRAGKNAAHYRQHSRRPAPARAYRVRSRPGRRGAGVFPGAVRGISGKRQAHLPAAGVPLFFGPDYLESSAPAQI